MATRSGLWAAFFALCGGLFAQADGLAAPVDAAALQAQAHRQHLSDEPTWQALLQLHNGQPQVRDPRFLLSAPGFSPEAELDATLALLHGPQARDAQCRFPARDAWLREQLQLPVANTDHCTAWHTFRQRAPMSSVSLIFAAEVLSQPSSMMGHLFLRTDGRLADGQDAAHAVSFFTDAGSWNLPKLFYDTMVVGSTGHFALTPYREAREHYANSEQRTLWRYTLNLTAHERLRLQAHMEELRQVQLTYYFQSYNCATLVDQLLRVARPTLPEGPGSWTTPREVLRRAQQGGLVADVSVETPARWRVRAVSGALTPAQAQAVDGAVQAMDIQKLTADDSGHAPTDFLRWQLAQADFAWRQETATASERTAMSGQAKAFKLGLQDAQPRFAHLELDADTQQQPAQTPPERQWGMAWRQQGDQHGLLLRAMPASHRLEDDNRARGFDSALALFEPVLWVQPEQARARLDSFTLYGVRSHLPRDPITGGLSGTFRMAWAPQASATEPTRQAWLAEGSVGYTWRVHDDVDTYALMGGGMGWRRGPYGYLQPELGAVIREVADLKTWVRAQWISRPLGSPDASLGWTLTQSWSPAPSWSVQAEWQRVRQAERTVRQWQLGVTHLY